VDTGSETEEEEEEEEEEEVVARGRAHAAVAADAAHAEPEFSTRGIVPGGAGGCEGKRKVMVDRVEWPPGQCGAPQLRTNVATTSSNLKLNCIEDGP
jgi:hypothetical protein